MPITGTVCAVLDGRITAGDLGLYSDDNEAALAAVDLLPTRHELGHRHERRLKKQIKEQQIERHENADHRRFQQQQKDVFHSGLFYC